MPSGDWKDSRFAPRMPSSGRRRPASDREGTMIPSRIRHFIDEVLTWENYVDIFAGLSDNY